MKRNLRGEELYVGSGSLGRAANFAEVKLAEFIQHLGVRGITVVSGIAQSVADDLKVAEAWLNRPS